MSLKISELPVASSVAGADVLAVVQGGVTKQVAASVLVPAGAGSGTVTSVDVAVPADMTSTGGPVTGSGTITLGRVTQTANTVLAGPTSGVGAAPTYRSLVANDIPSIAESKVTNLSTDLATLTTSIGTKAPSNRSIATTAPITGGGDLSADRTLAIAKATAGVDGYLAAADFTTFAAKVGPTRAINTTAPVTGGGDLSADRTIAMAKSTGSVDGYLAAADFTAFNAKVGTARTINTTAPLSGGGDLSADRTIAFSNQNANTHLAGPTSGSAAAPTFRALVHADIPAATLGVMAAMAAGFNVPAVGF